MAHTARGSVADARDNHIKFKRRKPAILKYFGCTDVVIRTQTSDVTHHIYQDLRSDKSQRTAVRGARRRRTNAQAQTRGVGIDSDGGAHVANKSAASRDVEMHVRDRDASGR